MTSAGVRRTSVPKPTIREDEGDPARSRALARCGELARALGRVAARAAFEAAERETSSNTNDADALGFAAVAVLVCYLLCTLL